MVNTSELELKNLSCPIPAQNPSVAPPFATKGKRLAKSFGTLHRQAPADPPHHYSFTVLLTPELSPAPTSSLNSSSGSAMALLDTSSRCPQTPHTYHAPKCPYHLS